MIIPCEILHSGLRALLSGNGYYENGAPDTIQSDPFKDRFGLSPRADALRILRMASYINPNATAHVKNAVKSHARGSSERYCMFVDASAIGPKMRVMPLGATYDGMGLDTFHLVANRVSFLRKILISHNLIEPDEKASQAQLRLGWWGYLNSCVDLAFEEGNNRKTQLPPDFWSILFSFYPEPNIVVIAKIDTMFGFIADIDPTEIGDLTSKEPVADSW